MDPSQGLRVSVVDICGIRFLLLGSVVCAVAACASRPVLLNASEEGVIVRYNPDAMTATEAAAAAQASCAKYGRNAVPGETAVTGEVFATFSCIR
jgi:hypothetical protein